MGKETVLEGLDKEIFYRREDGSVWADLTKDGLDEKNAAAFIVNLYERGVIDEREALIIRSALCGSSLEKVHPSERNIVRADIMRHIIMALMN